MCGEIMYIERLEEVINEEMLSKYVLAKINSSLHCTFTTKQNVKEISLFVLPSANKLQTTLPSQVLTVGAFPMNMKVNKLRTARI